ncbi:MAG: hypothetical protein AAFO01_13960 [Pseudomonadota bacterium]
MTRNLPSQAEIFLPDYFSQEEVNVLKQASDQIFQMRPDEVFL